MNCSCSDRVGGMCTHVQLVVLEKDLKDVTRIKFHITYTNMHACMYTPTCIHACTHTMHACTHPHTHACTHTCMHNPCMHAPTHACMHMHTHTCVLTTFLTIAGLCCRSLLTVLGIPTTPSFSTCSRTLSMAINVPVRPTPALCVYVRVCACAY